MTTAPAPAELLDRLLLVTALLARDQARFEQQHDLTGARVHLLWQLGSDGAVTQRELAAALGVTPRNVTGLVDGLSAQGHVRRDPHPDDRRAVLVSLTASGRRFVDDLRHQHAELADQLFGALDTGRRATLASELAALGGTLTELVEGR